MDDSIEFTRDQEISTVSMRVPHVVILGAGASRAAFPNGDVNGIKLPLMNDLIDILQLKNLLDRTSIQYEGRNFEDVYSELYSIGQYEDLRHELEKKVYKYFSSMQLPEEPTLYDYIILGLRKKDVIATFNWDPFLVQAAMRNSTAVPHPQLLFLHGNVKVGYCLNDEELGINSRYCSKCYKLLTPTTLLYPIKEKNYEEDPMLAKEWEMLRYCMKDTFMFTVFGYGAPQTDKSAIDLLKLGWGSPEKRTMEETEIIDIRPRDELIRVWQEFIFSHHYSIYDSFFNSTIFRNPRRTGEAYFARCVRGKFVETNPAPRNLSLIDLHAWFKNLREVELEAEEN